MAHNAPGTEALPAVPATWPGAFGLYKYSKQAVKPNVWNIVIVYVVGLLISFTLSGAFDTKEAAGFVVGFILSNAVSSVMTAALIIYYLAGVRGKTPELGEVVSKAFGYVLTMFVLTILTSVILGASLIALVVPFFFVYPRLLLAPYFLVDKKLGIIDSIKASWEASRGHAVKLWAITFATLAMALLMLTIIGIPFAVYFLVMYSAAFGVFYEFVNRKTASSSASAPKPLA